MVFIIAHVHISFGMGCELRFTAALGSDETKCYKLPLSQIKTCAGVVITKTVVCEPLVDMTLFPGFQHLRAEHAGLGFIAFPEPVVVSCGGLAFQREGYSFFRKDIVDCVQERPDPSYTQIGRGLIYNLFYHYRGQAGFEGTGHLGSEFINSLAAEQCGENSQMAVCLVQFGAFFADHLIEGKMFK